MTPFLVKLDEHLGKAHLQLLRESGYDVDTVLGERLSGSSDEFLWSRVVADGRLLITLDLDFSDVRRFQPGTHPGILLIRAHSTSSSAVLRVLRRALAERPLEDLRGCLAVADERITRVRWPPDEP
jgi:predicted nuclease of predicted toxin-antitoxin system